MTSEHDEITTPPQAARNSCAPSPIAVGSRIAEALREGEPASTPGSPSRGGIFPGPDATCRARDSAPVLRPPLRGRRDHPPVYEAGCTYPCTGLVPRGAPIDGDDRYSRIIRWLERRYPATEWAESFSGAEKNYLTRVDMRRSLVLRYSWAIPNAAALEAIAEASSGRVVEVGAGTGYWARLLSERGVDVVAYDENPPGTKIGAPKEAAPWHSGRKPWFDVRRGGPADLVEHSDRALLLCWPPYDEPLASDCVRAYLGDVVVYVGEGDGGCTGDSDFFATLTLEGFASDRVVVIPQWYGINDYLEVYRRTRTPDEAKAATERDWGCAALCGGRWRTPSTVAREDTRCPACGEPPSYWSGDVVERGGDDG